MRAASSYRVKAGHLGLANWVWVRGAPSVGGDKGRAGHVEEKGGGWGRAARED
jgi:hypothetical protein